MTGLLAADAVAVLDHVLIDVLVADLGLLVLDADLVEGFVQAEVAHDGRNDLVVDELVLLFQVQAVDVDDVVAGDDVARLIHAQAAVGVAVVSKADVEPVVHHELLQVLDVSGAAVRVDVVPVRVVVHDEGLCAESVKDRFGDGPCRAVRDVEADLDVLEAVLRQRDEVADVAVAAGDVVDRTSDGVALCDGDFGLAVDVVFDEQQGLFVHLLAVAVDDLDAVVVVRVVGRGDHDAAVELVDTGDVRDRRSRGDMHDVCVGTGGHEARAERVLEHVARTAGVLTDDDFRFFAFAGAVVPAEETADLDGVFKGQVFVGFAAEAVGSEIFTHFTVFPSFRCLRNTYRCPRSARRRPLRHRR